MPAQFFNEIILLIIAAFVGGFAARSFSLPPVLGYITSGIVFGMIGQNFFQSYTSLVEISEIGITLLLFTLGFEVTLENIKKINKKIILLGFLQVIATSIIFIPLFLVFHFDLKIAILFSVLFSFSSTAVVVKILEEKGQLHDFPGNNVFVFLLMQDLFIVPVIFFLPLLFADSQIAMSDISMFFLSLAKTIAVFIFVLFISKFVLPKITNVLFRYPSHELTILGTIFIAFLSIGLLTGIGLPQTIAAFLAGVLISEEGKNLAPLSEIRPLRDIFLVLFFVLTGMLINMPFVISHIGQIIALVVLVLAFKFAIIFLLLRSSGYIPGAAIFIASYLANIGEFAAVIGQFTFTSSYINQDDYNILLSVFIFSLVLIPFTLKYFKRVAEKLGHTKFLKGIYGDSSYSFKNYSKDNFSNHVVICGHGRMGSQIRSLLDFAGISYVVIDFNRKIISELSSISKFAIYGDPTDDEVLKGASIENAKILVVALPDRISQKRIVKSTLALNPKITILTRSHIEEDKFELLNLGVNSIVIPEFEAGIKLGTEILEIFGLPNESIFHLIKRLRKEHLL